MQFFTQETHNTDIFRFHPPSPMTAQLSLYILPNKKSFSLSVFYPFEELPANLIKFEIVVCKLFHFGRV